ncbi:MAG: hypothetical protein ABSF32_02815 [Ignavibacteria bacterium]
MKIIHIQIVIFMELLLFLCTSITSAQNNKNDFGDKIQKIKLEKLMKRLDLDENSSAVFKEKYIDFSKSLKALNKKRFQTYKLMTENLESGNGLDTLVDQIIKLENDVNQLKQDFAIDIKTILTPKQIATMIIFERKFNSEIMKLLKDYQQKNQKKDSQ